jgi:hypothetical protein
MSFMSDVYAELGLAALIFAGLVTLMVIIGPFAGFYPWAPGVIVIDVVISNLLAVLILKKQK